MIGAFILILVGAAAYHFSFFGLDRPTAENAEFDPSEEFDSGLSSAPQTRPITHLETPNAPTNSYPQALPASEAVPIAAGMNWSIADLVALSTAGSEIFAGNEQLWEYTHAGPFSKNLVFQDGEPFTVQFDLTYDPGETTEGLDDGVSPGFFEPLSEAARQGNGVAARQLQQALRHCASGPRTIGELDDTVQALLTGAFPTVPDDYNQEQYIARLEAQYARCEGTTDEMIETSLELLWKSGEGGDRWSAIDWAHSALDSQPDLAAQTFNRLWNQSGDISALSALARIHKEKSPATYEEAVTAYAYRYAALLVGLAQWDGSGNEFFGRLQEPLLEELQQLENSVPYSVSQDGRVRARNLILSNPNCCK